MSKTKVIASNIGCIIFSDGNKITDTIFPILFSIGSINIANNSLKIFNIGVKASINVLINPFSEFLNFSFVAYAIPKRDILMDLMPHFQLC